MRRSHPALLAAVVLGAVVLVGCGSSADPDGAPTGATATRTPSPSPTPSPTPTPSPSPTLAVLPASAPVRLTVPAIGVDTELMDLGLNPDGTLEVPPGAFPAGWYTGGPTPGERGPAVIAGHVSWRSDAGVFHDLAALQAGDVLTVQRADRSMATFVVTAVQEYPKDTFPTEAVYGNTLGSELRLITCGGDFDTTTGHFVDNVVVYAVLVPSADGP
ncbi:class F sortase [Cellulomonas hominis]